MNACVTVMIFQMDTQPKLLPLLATFSFGCMLMLAPFNADAEGNVNPTVDLRRVYETVAHQWMGPTTWSTAAEAADLGEETALRISFVMVSNS